MSSRRGLTLIELVLAVGLFAMLTLVVVQIVGSTMKVWTRAEGQRFAIGTHTTISSQVLEELDQLASGEHGDLLVDWELFDTDGDGIATQPLQRVRFVRRANSADLVRLGLREVDPQNPSAARIEGGELPLLEVFYCVLPADRGPLLESTPGFPGDAVLWRGERLLEDRGKLSCFASDFFVAGFPPPGSAEPIQGGVLWFELQCAGRGTDLERGWKVGPEATDAVRAWDSDGGRRLRTAVHPFNANYSAMPAFRGEPLFPRRLRLVLEVAGPKDALACPHLAAPLVPEDDEMVVDRPQNLPPSGSLVLIGEEWVEIGFPGRRTRLHRPQRGSSIGAHREGTPIQIGRRFEREVDVPLAREDWRK
ncbi:MAG: prepilin-type N-terminal cleavage/methylation domain-containing protein [Planctomycetota bacterium]